MQQCQVRPSRSSHDSSVLTSSQSYVSQLAQVPKDALEREQCKIVVIGCGEWSLIDNYKSIIDLLNLLQYFRTDLSSWCTSSSAANTGFEGAIYADPTRALYRKLGITIENLAGTPSGQEKKSYVRSVLPVTLSSIWASLLL